MLSFEKPNDFRKKKQKWILLHSCKR